ncbi:MAG: UvrB/UvrC motif-containing protein, partial [Planctomycetota bacterium]
YYTVFRQVLFPIIEKIHSAKKHKGKRPATSEKMSFNIAIQIKELEIQLKEAIKKEEYEKAAKIRDKIRELQKLLESNEKQSDK